MSYDNRQNAQEPAARVKVDGMARWMRTHWMLAHPEQDWVVLSEGLNCLNEAVLNKVTDEMLVADDYRYVGSHELSNSYLPAIYNYYSEEGEGILTTRTGGWVYRFEHVNTHALVDVLVMAAYYNDIKQITALACVPRPFVALWDEFIQLCGQLARPEDDEVTVIGGNQNAYKPTVDWDDVILPAELKETILRDVESFFERGVDVYRKLDLNPFRKILLAGVPGTGKTMLCNALAKMALAREHNVIYVSSADMGGSHFYKIQQALSIASRDQKPTLILLEEIDAFLNDKQKALFLNVLDGVESFINEAGTLLISTTNYPEAIDERVLKRPGRMDRIYIVPPVENEAVAERILRRYLGDLWREEHVALVDQIVGYPGAFVREMVVYAVTQQLDRLEDDGLSVEALTNSFDQLQKQIRARDKLVQHNIKNNGKVRIGFGDRG